MINRRVFMIAVGANAIVAANIVGGSIMVAAVYHLIYRRTSTDNSNIGGQRSSDQRP